MGKWRKGATSHVETPVFEAKTHAQKRFLNSIMTEDVVIGIGAAGTGKSYVSAYAAVDLYDNYHSGIQRIVVTKPMVETGGGSKFGALPGDKDEKFIPWLGSILDPLQKFLTRGRFEVDYKRGNIIMEPLAFCRGRSFSDTIILVEEAQNCTVEEIKMISTRVGENSKLVISGDTSQIDLRKEDSGLIWLVNEIDKQSSNIPVIKFGREDCVRSRACGIMLDLFEKAYESKSLR